MVQKRFEARFINDLKLTEVKGTLKVGHIFLDQDQKILLLDYLDVNTIPYVQKTKLLIVKNGGITSHAVIVAKEFNIPLILGTNSFDDIPDGTEICVNFKNNEVMWENGRR